MYKWAHGSPLLADPGSGEVGEARPDRGAAAPSRPRDYAEAAVSRGVGARALRDGLLLGRRAEVLGARRRLLDGCGLRGRPDEEPHLPRGLLRRDGPHRSRAGRLRSAPDLLRRAPAHVLGEPRSHPGHAAGERRRHAVPQRHLHHQRRAARRSSRVARGVPEGADGFARGPDHDRDRGGAALLLRRGLPPAVPGEEPRRLLRAGRHRRLLPGRHRPALTHASIRTAGAAIMSTIDSPEPTCVESHTAARSTRAPTSTRVPAPSTTPGPTRAPWATCAPAWISTGPCNWPSMRAVGCTCTPGARSSVPANGSASGRNLSSGTLPCSMSRLARRSERGAPRSPQYPDCAYPCTFAPSWISRT